MKVKFIKDHLEHKAGEEKELPNDLANYLVLMQVVKKATEKKEVKQDAEKKEFVKGKEKKEK